MKVSYATIGQNVRRAREAAGLSLEGMAGRVRFSPTHLMRVEAGERPVSLEELAALCDVLDVLPAQLREHAFN